MLLRYFNSSYYSRLIALLLLAVLLWLPALFIPQRVLHPAWISPLFDLYLFLPIHSGWIHLAIALFINTVTALIINSIAVGFGLSKKASYISAVLYILFSSSLPLFTQMQPFIFINLLFAFYLLNLFSLSTNKNNLVLSFNGGFFIGLMTLLFPPLIVLLLIHFIGLMLNRVNNIHAWFSGIIGFILPFVYLFTYYYWVGDAVEMWNRYAHSLILRFYFINPDDLFSDIILGIIIILFVAAGEREYRNLFRRKIAKRRNISMLLYLFVIIAFIYLFFTRNLCAFTLFFVPASILVNDYLRFVKRIKLAEIAVTTLIIMAIINQYFQLYYAS